MATDDERDRIGEALYMKILSFEPDAAGKITGMMLDSLEDSELSKVMDDEPLLKKKVAQALKVLKKEADPQHKTQENGKSKDKAKDQVKMLQDELSEAEKWAEEMQREWDTKEAKWKKEKDDLLTRLKAAEGVAEAAASKKTNGNDKAKLLESKVTDTEERLKASEEQNAELKKQLLEKEERLKQELAAKDARPKDDGGKEGMSKKELAAKDLEVMRANAAAKEASAKAEEREAHSRNSWLRKRKSSRQQMRPRQQERRMEMASMARPTLRRMLRLPS
jgi:hypothetical protein